MNNQSGNPKGMMNNTDLIKRFLDMANCADASYAMLHWIDYKKKDDKNANNKTGQDDKNEDGDGKKIGYINPDNGLITTYARAIESRFNEEKVIGEDCRVSEFSAIPACSPKTLGNDITNIPKDTPHDQISQRTKDFVSRFELLEHKPNDETSGFSATLFKDKDKEEYIFAIRGSNERWNDWVKTNAIEIFLKEKVPKQYLNLLDFYDLCVEKHPAIKKEFILTGHSLGGYLSQLLFMAFAIGIKEGNIKEAYTFNAPSPPRPFDLVIENQKGVEDDALFSQIIEALEKKGKYNPSWMWLDQEEAKNIFIQFRSSNANKEFLGIKLAPINTRASTRHLYVSAIYEAFSENEDVKINNNLLKIYQAKEMKEDIKLPPIYYLETTIYGDLKEHPNENNTVQHYGKKLKNECLPLYTDFKGGDDHKLFATICTLYFYSYLLELSSNQEKVQDKSLIEGIEYLNKFASNVKKHYEKVHSKDSLYLPLLLSDIAKSLKKNNLLKNAEKYSKIDSSNLADFIMELIEGKHFIKILEAKDLKEFCDIHKINAPKNKAYKEAFADFRPFIFTDSDDNPTQTQIAYSYNSNTFYKMCNNQWGEEFIKSQYGAMKGLYFDGKVVLCTSAISGSLR